MATVQTIQAIDQGKVRIADPCIMVVFGAAGDLTKRKLIPALYNLAAANLLPENFALIGVARRPMDSSEFRKKLADEVAVFAGERINAKVWGWLEERINYVSGNFQDPEVYRGLNSLLTELDEKYQTNGNYLYYLATPPESFGVIVDQLGSAGMAKQDEHHWRRVVIEKPFGTDLTSARALNVEIQKVLSEDQIYRIDHYLGKETVQNLMVFRFANGVFEPIWNREHIENVQITVAESVGVEGRGRYYDHSGALRDVVENHMFQLLELTAMDAPSSYEEVAVRDCKAAVLNAVKPFTKEDVLQNVVRGQYVEGRVGQTAVPAYKFEDSVSPESLTETYVAMKMMIDNPRWKGVPFYLRTGKALNKRTSEIAIQFKRSPFKIFGKHAEEHLAATTLVLTLQPDEGISMRFGAKVPGPLMTVDMVRMDFCYETYFGKDAASGYETLLYDTMLGDATLFTRSDNIEQAWLIVDAILKTWKAAPADTLYPYQAGTWGPSQADDLLQRDHHKWHELV